MINKIIGYALLVAGLLLIIFTLYQSYNIFMRNSPAPLMFKVQTSVAITKTNNIGDLQDLQKQLKEEVSKQISQMIPTDTLPKILNLFSWSILAGILIFGGGQIAGLGVKMLK
ncbi:MAG: hypothetical protein A2904_02235 [Candidatus Staskawiczbacteria bacterium RIFCSPLOWO2_01_FULL_33_9]|uniref:Uncharacterized protein n=1 Tax=Candidatus Staskawiczbacteria bacterium RIFCSPLOWO2_01_FULL_33_9 TaxID=1802211 RepID=A0A1G2IAI7_9BACT|nr:MAG: hypothetical protein A2904_02235 [Candidatus Staskawiczbacteria bacterium RIFCSPLOWO2_01_FULL_33_9]